MKILFITIAWPNPGDRNLYSDLMEEFHNKGHEIFILCADENVQVNSFGEEKGINVVRVSTSKLHKANKFQKIMMAATFAEVGEWETAKDLAPSVELSSRQTWLDRFFSAITFAEYGLYNDAVSYLKQARVKNEKSVSITDDLGLKGVRLVYGTVTF